MTNILISPRDPVIARDGRPFQIGQRVKSLDWIYPSVVAGSLRTLIGKQNGFSFNDDEVKQLLAVKIRGLLPFADGKLFFPKPLDCVVKEDSSDENKGTVYAARPQALNENEGCNLPQGLQPVLLPDESGNAFKPKKTAAFWSWKNIREWLAQENVNGETFEQEDFNDEQDGNGNKKKNENVLKAPQQEERVHVKIEAATGASEKKMLFSTTGLDFHNIQIAVNITVPDDDTLQRRLNELDAWHPLGGERRLVHWKKNNTQDMFPQAPPFKETNRIRMVLATPAIFTNGYLPAWINKDTLTGNLPYGGVKVKLIGAIIERWLPLSGWSYAKNKRGPKDVRRLVPAGSVYFFEITEGTLQDAVNANWLKNVCSDPQNNTDTQNNRDGFGLSLWGIW